jgi:phospholipid transport system transporter-binding protein
VKPDVQLDNGCLRVAGDIDPQSVVAVRRLGETLMAKEAGELEVDLSGLGAAHSVVLSLLLCWVRYARAHQISLVFTGASERLRSLAALSGLQQHLTGLA